MRLIEADALYNRYCNLFEMTVGDAEIDRMAYIVASAPTVNAVEVVYCKDCQYARALDDTEKRIYLDECKACYNGDATIEGYNIVMPEHYCSYGKRRE